VDVTGLPLGFVRLLDKQFKFERFVLKWEDEPKEDDQNSPISYSKVFNQTRLNLIRYIESGVSDGGVTIGSYDHVKDYIDSRFQVHLFGDNVAHIEMPRKMPSEENANPNAVLLVRQKLVAHCVVPHNEK